MSATPLRAKPPRFRRSRGATVEALLEEIGALVAERQELRAGGASRSSLERNRRRIARTQWQLSFALIARYVHRKRDAA